MVPRFKGQRLDLWSLKPPVRGHLPAVHDSRGTHNPIDFFVRSKLEAAGLTPSPEADRSAKEVKADADFAVAKERCDDLKKGKPRDACVDRAEHDRDAAVRMAKIERVMSSSELKQKQQERRMGGAPETPAARYAAEKARCEMQGTERDRCLAVTGVPS